MAAQNSDYLRRTFPPRELLRGNALVALLWSIVAAFCFSGLLFTLFLVFSLLASNGSVVLDPHQVSEFEQLFQTAQQDGGSSVVVYAAPVELTDIGLKAVAWELRHRPISAPVAGLCRGSEVLQVTGSSLFYLLAVALLCGFLLNAIAAHIRTLASRCGINVASQVRESLHRHALRTAISDLKGESSSEALSLFTSEIQTVRLWIERYVELTLRAPIRLAVVALVAICIEPSVTFECAVPLLGCWLLIRRDEEAARKTRELEQDRASTELRLLTEGMTRSRLVRGYQIEEFEHARFKRHMDRYHNRLAAIERRQRNSQWLERVLLLIACSIVLFLLGTRMLAVSSEVRHLSVAEGLLLLSCLALSWKPLEQLAELPIGRESARHAADRIYRYLNTIPDVSQAVGAKFLQPLDVSITFENVTRRVGSRKLFDGLDLTIPRGGSSALVAFDSLEALAAVWMLPRFLEPHEGRICINGEDIAWATLESLRSEILIVDGNGATFTGTVHENIGAGDARFSMQQVIEAAKRAHAHNFIQKLPQGYESVIGEHGEQLSVTESFLIALARALLRDPALLVIIEPFGDVTDDEKALVEDACRQANVDRTVIYVPSRMSTLRSVDRIVLLNHGKVEVVGTHEVLLNSSPLYRHWEYLNFNEFRHDTSTAPA